MAVASILLASSCGYVGPPRPPALNIPTPAQDLRVMEFGDQVLVQFTVPLPTTDAIVQQRLRGIEVYAGPGGQPFNREEWAATASRFPVAEGAAPGPKEVAFPASGFVDREIVIGVRITGETGRVSDWSGFETLVVNAPLARPTAVQAANTLPGVALRWSGSGPRHRVLRSTPDALTEKDRELIPIGETETAEFVDMTAIYGTRYQYVVVALAGERQESFASAAVSITPADAFAPRVPSNLAITPSLQSIDLTWTHVVEDDFQGYNVRRSVDGGSFDVVARLIAMPAYSDRAVEPGKQYRYAITSVDELGNESAPSEAVTAVLP